jgi:hypothetical protein
MSAWNRNQNRLAAVVLAIAGLPTITLGDDAPKPEKPPAAKPSTAFDPIELTIHASTAPIPALKYRLFPLESERNPGDAAPIYIRVCLRIKDEMRKEIGEKAAAWKELPLDRFPTAEARKFVDQFKGSLDQIAFGARRQSCNWNYTLNEQKEDAIMILMPDAQELRDCFRLLALKARVEIAEKKYDEAIRTVETGLAFGRHIGEGPFLISTLIGVSCVNVMLAELDVLLAQPDAPNLYWALTALPRPVISMRTAMENEQELGVWLVPEIADLDRPRVEAEWSALLARLHARLRHLEKAAVAVDGKVIDLGQDTTLAQFRTQYLPEARAYFQSRNRSTEGMSDDQILILSIADRHRELSDDWYKLFYLSSQELAPHYANPTRPNMEGKKGPIAIFAALLPTVVSVKIAETQADRKVAALRIVEALRMHAAAKEGGLPASLDEIKEVPIPLDPMTGKPFAYHLEGATAVLSGPPPQPKQPSLTYRITLRK